LRWLEAEFPRYLEAYRRAYDGRVYLRGAYRQRIDDTLLRLRRKHGFEDPAPERQYERPPLQLALFA
ncbi:MAG TPA: hypothetical protein VFO85_20735, partial [Vicinamibacteria bacterium]|nr:hypothetical protein [Vicinamibacteria bacterium]